MEMLGQFIDIVLHLDRHLELLLTQYGTWIYAILFLIIFCETGLVVTPFLPGDSLLFVAGALVAKGGGLEIVPLCATLSSAAVIGDNVNYWVGRFFGPRVFRWEQSRFFNRAAFDKTHAFYEKHGGKALLIARYMPLVRTFAPFVAGVAKMTYPRFVLVDAAGGLTWVTSLCSAGYLFGNVAFVKNNLTAVIFAIIGLSLLPLAIGWWKHRSAAAAVAAAQKSP